MPISSFDRIVDLLNEASLVDDVQVKVTKLLQVKELTIHHESSLLDNFFEEVAAFQHDPNFEVRKVVIGFIEEACQVDPTLLRKAIGYLFYLFSSATQQEPPALNLIRCLASSLVSLHRLALTRAVRVGLIESGVTIVSVNGISADSAADVALETFRSVAGLKDEIVRLMLPQAVTGRSPFAFMRPIQLNDNVRHAVISLVESVIILQSRRLPNSEIPPSREGDISLDQIPDMTNAQLEAVLRASTAASSATLQPGICLVRPHRLSDEAERLFTALLDWPVRGKSTGPSGLLSCPTLEILMDTLVTIARQRPQYMDRVVQLFETIHVTFPPYFSDVQVSNVRKRLKSGLLQLLRHPASTSDYQGRITILLTDLGATQAEVMNALQKPCSNDTGDHGDVDMRQLTSIRHPDRTVNASGAVSSQSQPPVSHSGLATSTAAQPTLTMDPTKSQPVSNFPLLDPESALRFEDDDDDDDDDDDTMQIHRRRRGSRHTKRSSLSSSTTTTGSGAGGDTKTVTAGASSKTGPLDLPPVDFVTTRLVPKLTTANVADLVLLSMVTLPDQMPAAFHSTYTPIAAAGTSAQIRHLARMLAVQLVVWAGESGHPDPSENLSQLESLLRPSQDELEELGVPGIPKRSHKGDSSDSTGMKTGAGRVKKRRTNNEADTEVADEDALVRANAARRMQPMNISTLINYNQQQQQQQPVKTASGLGLLPFDPSIPPPAQPMFDRSQPPPLLPLATSTTSSILPTPIAPLPSVVPLSVPEVVSAPVPARPFSLDAVTVPLARSTQRQLARDAFVRILEELDDSSYRRPVLGTGTEGNHPLGTDLSAAGTQQHLSRMKLLTRLTIRRFGGNEFYNILIDYAVKNLRNGFELLSKLLMQEYCRFRGFQLVGFDAFLESRREQLRQLRARQLGKPSWEPTEQDEDAKKSENTNESTKPELDGKTVDQEASTSVVDENGVQEESAEKKAEDNQSDRTTTKLPDQKAPEVKTRVISSPDDLGCLSFYDCLLIEILQRLASPEVRESYFGRFLLEAPLLTPGALSVLKHYCCTPSQTQYGFEVLRTLIELRPVGQREDLLNMLLNFCAVDNTEVRQSALTAARELAAVDAEWQEHIETFAISGLRKMLQPRPTADIFPFNPRPSVPSAWNDEACQACAHLFLGLMTQSPSLLHELAKVYVTASADVKRSILRMIDTPIREIGLYSAAIHDLVDRCPVGAETLVTRVIHLLTDNASATAAAQQSKIPSVVSAATPPVIFPPPTLVERVYRLYHERVHDIRCLITVIVGLPKHEVIAVLPRVVQLSEKVVKEVLVKLLHASVATQYAPIIKGIKSFDGPLPNPDEDPAPLGPLKPEELLVAIHLLEFAKDPAAAPSDNATPAKPYVSLQAILHACRVCFAERRLFTQERLSVAIGQLLDQPVLPTLFMRTVMQALALHPRLAGYVINVLVNLIPKQIWKSEKLWEGFIRCCVKTRPQSYQVLLQLPPERLEDVFKRESGMRLQVRRYVENFSSAQRVHISKSIIDVLERAPTPKKAPVSKSVESNSETARSLQPGEEHASVSRSPSPSSSGPGTPTVDEAPIHAVVPPAVQFHEAPNAMALPVLVGGQTVGSYPVLDARSVMERFQPIRVDSRHHSGRERESSPFAHEIEEISASTTDSVHASNKRPIAVDIKQEASQSDDPGASDVAPADDDSEPPILPPTKIPPAKKRREETTQQLTDPFDQTPLDWSTEDPDDVVMVVEPAGRPKRAVDLEKLEADRKRLEEEGLKYKKLRAERKKASDSRSVRPETTENDAP